MNHMCGDTVGCSLALPPPPFFFFYMIASETLSRLSVQVQVNQVACTRHTRFCSMPRTVSWDVKQWSAKAELMRACVRARDICLNVVQWVIGDA